MQKAKNQKLKLKNLGDQAYTNSDFEKAIDMYTKALDLDPNNPALFNNRALSYYRMCNYQNSLVDAESAVKLDVKFQKAYVRMIQIFLELGQPEEAAKRLQEGIIECGEVEELMPYKQVLQRESAKFKDKSKWSKMVQWLEEGGAKFPKLMVAEFTENYRGIMAKRNIQKKDKILYIPLSRMITLEMSKEIALSRAIVQNNVQLQSPKHTFLTLFLLEETLKESSEWKPYIDLLPKEFPSFPIFYTKEELEMLEGSSFLFMVHEKVLDLKKDYDTVSTIDPSFSKTYDFKMFCWARTVVCSRIFGLTIDGNKSDALVPFADMINHRIPKQSSWVFVQNQKGFVMQAIQDVQRGHQVFDSYGKKCNSRFLLNYGFVIPGNQSNEVPFKVSLDNKDPLFGTKIKLVGKGHQVRIFKVTVNPLDVSFLELMGFLRFQLVEDAEVLSRIQELNNLSQAYTPTKTPPITRQLEVRCWEHIHNLATQALKRYPTDQKQDSQRLKSVTNNENALNCLTLTMGEKHLYSHFVKMSEEMVALLRMSLDQVKNQVTRQDLLPYFGYIQKVVAPLTAR